MSANVSTTAFPPGTKVYVFPFGSVAPGPGSDSDESRTVPKDGVVSFDTKLRPGQYVWLGGEVAEDDWQTVQVPVKEGDRSDVKHPGQRLSEVAAPSNHASNEVVHGARDTQNTRRSTGSSKRVKDPNEKMEFAANLTGAEALRISASGSLVTIPDGSHADPAAHQTVVPAHTDGLTVEEREAKAEARRRHEKMTGPAAARPKQSAQAESDKVADGQPTPAESTIDEPTELPEGGERTAL